MEINIVNLHKFKGRVSNGKGFAVPVFSEDNRTAFCYINKDTAYDLFDNSEYSVLLEGKYNANIVASFNSNDEVVRSARLAPISKFTKEELKAMRFNYMMAVGKSFFKKR
jgi:hypothetical protein